jgi:hypothetical protein
MLVLPVLPDELRIPLDKAGYEGVVAVVKPLDVETQSKWHDAFPGENKDSESATALVKQQLVQLEGLNLRDSAGAITPYNHADPLHWRSVPMRMRTAIYLKLMERATVGEELEKNSDLPSGSGGTSGTESSAAEAAVAKPGTS